MTAISSGRTSRWKRPSAHLYFGEDVVLGGLSRPDVARVDDKDDWFALQLALHAREGGPQDAFASAAGIAARGPRLRERVQVSRAGDGGSAHQYGWKKATMRMRGEV